MSTTSPRITAPTIQGSATPWDAAPVRYKLFSIVSEDPETGEAVTVDYTMPRAQHPGIVLEYLREARKNGEELAASWLLERVLGVDGYSALTSEPDLTWATVQQVVRLALQVLSGRAPAQPEADEAAPPQPEAVPDPFG